MIRTIGRIAFNLDTRRGTNLERPGDRHWMTKEQRISCNFQQLFFFFLFFMLFLPYAKTDKIEARRECLSL